jgi:hypothetical protein
MSCELTESSVKLQDFERGLEMAKGFQERKKITISPEALGSTDRLICDTDHIENDASNNYFLLRERPYPVVA